MDANKALMQQIVEMFNSGDVSDADRIFSPEYEDHQKPEEWDISGPEEFRQIVTNARRVLAHLHVTIEDLIAEGNRVAARLRWSSVDHAGAKMERETLEVLRIENGKVIEHWGAEAWKAILE
jgi:predicted SnoaL-like aldol condensation-catalyzing enzyme